MSNARHRQGCSTAVMTSCRPCVAGVNSCGEDLKEDVTGACEQITFNAETAEPAKKKCPRISQRALRALRLSVALFHRSNSVGGLFERRERAEPALALRARAAGQGHREH